MDFSVLKGKTIIKIVGANVGNEEIVFECSDGSTYKMYHKQDCCESVEIEDIVGEIEDIVGKKIVMAEEVEGLDIPKQNHSDKSFTWTFYKLATVAGYLTIRWYGASNGYYSESVDFEQVK